MDVRASALFSIFYFYQIQVEIDCCSSMMNIPTKSQSKSEYLDTRKHRPPQQSVHSTPQQVWSSLHVRELFLSHNQSCLGSRSSCKSAEWASTSYGCFI